MMVLRRSLRSEALRLLRLEGEGPWDAERFVAGSESEGSLSLA